MNENIEDAEAVGQALADVILGEIQERGLIGKAASDHFLNEYQRRSRHLRAAEVPVAALPVAASESIQAQTEAKLARIVADEVERRGLSGQAAQAAYAEIFTAEARKLTRAGIDVGA